MTNLTFERPVEIAVNMTMVKEHARQFHSTGGVTVGVSSSENVNRVKFVQNGVRGDILDRLTGNRVSKHQNNNVGVVAASVRHRQIQKMFPMCKTGHIAKSKVCKGKSRVRLQLHGVQHAHRGYTEEQWH